MDFVVEGMTKPFAEAIAGWRYEGIWAFYDLDRDEEDRTHLLDPANWPGQYYAVTDGQGTLQGFFCFDREGEGVEMGLGLRPDLTGRGLGRAFGAAGLALARETFGVGEIRLRVACWNVRAIRVYEALGFVPGAIGLQETSAGLQDFLTMTRSLGEAPEALRR